MRRTTSRFNDRSGIGGSADGSSCTFFFYHRFPLSESRMCPNWLLSGACNLFCILPTSTPVNRSHIREHQAAMLPYGSQQLDVFVPPTSLGMCQWARKSKAWIGSLLEYKCPHENIKVKIDLPWKDCGPRWTFLTWELWFVSQNVTFVRILIVVI